MRTPAKIGAFVTGLAVVFAVAAAAGNAVGPVAEPIENHRDSGHAKKITEGATDTPGGLMMSDQGYTFGLHDSTASAGSDVPVSFSITSTDGPVTRFDTAHGKKVHLIAVRRDLSGFQHVHPVMDSAGTWSTNVDLTPGEWRLFADFKPHGHEGLTLGADLAVPGDYRPVDLPKSSTTAQIADYTVTLGGSLKPGADSKLTLTVAKDGHPVRDLQPYLGAYGHLVALRDGDLAYLHVHPDGEPDDGRTEPGPAISFYASVPSPGDYRLFLDFQHNGVVRTAAFTAQATGTAQSAGEHAGGHTH